MNATVCPKCNALLTSVERAKDRCPRCKQPMGKLEARTSLSTRQVINRREITNDKSFCLRMSIICLILAFASMLAACGLMQMEASSANIASMVMSGLLVVALVVASVAGFFGLSGGLRNSYPESVLTSAIGLILSGCQLVFWFVTLSSLFG